jgi:hypothetical protein
VTSIKDMPPPQVPPEVEMRTPLVLRKGVKPHRPAQRRR